MAVFNVYDYYPDSDRKHPAFCKVSLLDDLLARQFYKTGCGMDLACCNFGHFHVGIRKGTFEWPDYLKWRPLPEYCLSQISPTVPLQAPESPVEA